MKKLFLLASCLLPFAAWGQSSPNWPTGYRPSAAEVNAEWASKQDVAGRNAIYAIAYGVKADGVTSDDAAMKAAFDDCATKGATLYLPFGEIKMTGVAGPITLQNCHVEGTGVIAGETALATHGTMLLLTSTTIKPFIAGSNWAWSGTNFFWPNQTTGSVVYPPLFNIQAGSGGCKWRFFHNVVVNAYDFLDDTPGTGYCEGEWNIHDNILYVMHYGISSAGQGDTIFVNNNQFSPGAWFNVDPVNSPSAWLVARANNWMFHVKGGTAFAWNIIAKSNAFFSWRGAFLLDATATVGISDVNMTTDFVSTLIDTSSGGTWATGNTFSVTGNCQYFGTGHAPPCFNLGLGSIVEVRDSVFVAAGSAFETAGSNVTLQSSNITGIGAQNDGTEYYGVHYTGGSGGEQIIIQDSTIQGNLLSNKAHVHGITTDVAPSRLVIQNNRMNFLNEVIDIQTAATTIITGNWAVGTNGASSVLISGTGGVQYANNDFDKGPNATLANCGGATVAQGAFSGFFTVGPTNPTTTCDMTFPFNLLGAGGGACQFGPSSNTNLWANVSGAPATWAIRSSADIHSQNVFFNCRAAQ
jgi:hypothetical protein